MWPWMRDVNLFTYVCNLKPAAQRSTDHLLSKIVLVQLSATSLRQHCHWLRWLSLLSVITANSLCIKVWRFRSGGVQNTKRPWAECWKTISLPLILIKAAKEEWNWYTWCNLHKIRTYSTWLVAGLHKWLLMDINSRDFSLILDCCSTDVMSCVGILTDLLMTVIQTVKEHERCVLIGHVIQRHHLYTFLT